MKPQFHNITQNSPEWDSLKLGRFTTSKFKGLFSKKSTQSYEKTIYQVVFERLTGEAPKSFSNQITERGHELEPEARKVYERMNFVKVQNGGFWTLGDWVGSSPDGLVENEGLLEIKSPLFNTLIKYLTRQKLPAEYYWQVHGQMYVTGRQWVDFFAYHPKLKPFIIRIYRDEQVMEQIEDKLLEGINKAKETLELLENQKIAV